MMKLGTKIIWLNTDTNNVLLKVISSGTITRISRDIYYTDNRHKSEDALWAIYALPDMPETRQVLQNFVDEAARHTKQDNENMSALYKCRNDLTNKGEL